MSYTHLRLTLRPRLHDTTSCQNGCSTGWMIVYMMQPVAERVVKPVEQQVVCSHHVNDWILGCMNQTGWNHITGWTTGRMFVYTIQPVDNRLSNQFDNRLHHVNGVWHWHKYRANTTLRRSKCLSVPQIPTKQRGSRHWLLTRQLCGPPVLCSSWDTNVAQVDTQRLCKNKDHQTLIKDGKQQENVTSIILMCSQSMMNLRTFFSNIWSLAYLYTLHH